MYYFTVTDTASVHTPPNVCFCQYSPHAFSRESSCPIRCM